MFKNLIISILYYKNTFFIRLLIFHKTLIINAQATYYSKFYTKDFVRKNVTFLKKIVKL
jgi:hypothetical protein